MIQLSIDDIELADRTIESMTLDDDGYSITIVADRVFRVSDRSRFGQTKIIISNRDTLSVNRHIAQNFSDKGEDVVVDRSKDFYRFNLIQETVVNNNDIFFGGWSWDCTGRLMYKFKNPDCTIHAEPLL